MSDDTLIGLVWFFSIFAAAAQGAERGRTLAGLGWGIFLGPFGLIAAGLLPRRPADQARYEIEVEQAKSKLRTDVNEQNRQIKKREELVDRKTRLAQAEFDSRPLVVTCPVCGRDNPCRPAQNKLNCVQCNEPLSSKKAVPV